ncbi:integrase catalytic domain-containing protein [Trichonephila clavipes]|nr:integrase catalytic domain-containing protein [Trichonephila clavipes]
MDVPKMWDLEVLGYTDPIEKKNESLLEEENLAHFKETIRIWEDQRYEVALPWLVGHPALCDKYDAAESKLRTATKHQLAKEVHYLPHRPVNKPSSSTIKVRPVFDASFKKPKFASLNECLSVGLSLIHKILPLLLRFRFGAIAVIADGKQAFLQIRLRTEDKDVLRFLWWENVECSKSCSLSNNWRRSGRSSFFTWGKQSVDSSINVCSVSSSPSETSLVSLSTESFMQALRNFWARRGRGSMLYTDNGTNFVGAANALKSLDWDFIQAECSLMKIKWLCSPPSAPWYGGFWKRMVRSIKELLRKCLGKSCVTYEEMLTLLYECEATTNGRPLTYLSDDPKELKPLTPAHFIQDITERETFDLDLIDSQHILKQMRYLHTLRSNLRKRFYKEYFGELVKKKSQSSFKKKDDFFGKDDMERVAKLRLSSGEIMRPLQRIYPLELSARDHLIEDHQGTDIGAQIPGPTAADVLEEGKKSRCGRPLIPVKRLNL